MINRIDGQGLVNVSKVSERNMTAVTEDRAAVVPASTFCDPCFDNIKTFPGVIFQIRALLSTFQALSAKDQDTLKDDISALQCYVDKFQSFYDKQWGHTDVKDASNNGSQLQNYPNPKYDDIMSAWQISDL